MPCAALAHINQVLSQGDTEEVKMIWKEYGRFYIL